MDAFVQLALMAKAKRVFESPDTFLSFPALSPLNYAPEDLDFSQSGIASAEDLSRISEFARITNQVPRGTVAPVEESEYLWDICSEVLAMGEPASGALSAGDQARLDAALALLYTPGAGGFRQDSPTLVAYKACRDAQITAEEEYRNQQFTAESATDPAVKTRWTTQDEPRLRQAVAAAEDAWRTHGQKAPVEEALQIEQICAARQPTLTWAEWKSNLLSDIDLATDTDQIRFATTVYTPSDVFDDSWPRFTLTATEMQRLVADAPPELLDIFGSGAAAGDIESVSFEYRSVALTRPWFPKRLFQERFWRMGNPGDLSDGATPPHGRCPSYITALVFARNVEVHHRQASGGAPPPHVAPGVLLQLSPGVVRADSAQLQLAKVASPPSARTVASVRQLRVAAPAAASPATHAAAAPMMARMAMARPATPQTPATAMLRPQLNINRVLLKRPGFVVRPPRPTGVSRPPPVSPPPPPVHTQPPPPPPKPEAPHDQIAILAFICRRVPRCANPDPNLTWG